MTHYRKIETRIWYDDKFCSLSKEGKLAFLYLLTHPNMTSLGAMMGTIEGLAAELNVLPEVFREAFDKGMFKVDGKANFIVLTNFLKYNKPENPNVVIAWGKGFDMLPECELKSVLYKRVKDSIKDYGKGYQEAFSKAFSKEYAETGSSEQ